MVEEGTLRYEMIITFLIIILTTIKERRLFVGGLGFPKKGEGLRRNKSYGQVYNSFRIT